MAQRRKNLLDAFRASQPAKPASVRPENADVVRSAPPRVAPVASAHPAQGPLPARVNTPPAPQTAARKPGTHADVAPPAPPISGQRVVLLALLAVTIAVSVYVALRPARQTTVDAGNSSGAVDPRATNGVVPPAPNASEGASAPAANTAANPAASGNPMLDPTAGYTDFDRAFYDKKNRFTVRVGQYASTPEGTKLALDAYRYLKNEGVRVVQPVRSPDGRALYLCAFAEAKKDDIDAWCEQVKKLRGPSGTKYPFATAYVDNIDHVVAR